MTWPSAIGAVVSAGSYDLAPSWVWQSGVITSVAGKTSGGSFTFSIRKNGVAVPSLSAVTIASATLVTTLAGVNTIGLGNTLTLVIATVTGSPTDASLQVGFTHSQA